MNQYFKKRKYSFIYAFKGFSLFFKTQPNGIIHLAFALAVMLAGYFFRLSNGEWMILIVAIGLVFIAELFNTAIEFLTDMVSPEYNVKAGKVKDLAAAAVLFASITALAVGVILFSPKILG
jgi:diacylglycerol kinase